MILFKKIIRKILKKLRTIKNNFGVKYEQLLWRGSIKIAKTTKFYQKVRINGEGSVIIGENTAFGFELGPMYNESSTIIQARTKEAKIIIGNNCHFNNNVYICSLKEIKIGNNCLIGNNVTMLDFDGHSNSKNPDERKYKPGEIEEIKIGDNVWIGCNVSILRGAEIGDNSIIAAGSVVNRKFKSDSYIGGVPAITFGKIQQ